MWWKKVYTYKSTICFLCLVNISLIYCIAFREVYEYMIAQQKEKGKSKSGKGESITLQQLQAAHGEYEEEATLCAFRLKSLKQGQSRSLLTQAARHHAAQVFLNFRSFSFNSLRSFVVLVLMYLFSFCYFKYSWISFGRDLNHWRLLSHMLGWLPSNNILITNSVALKMMIKVVLKMMGMSMRSLKVVSWVLTTDQTRMEHIMFPHHQTQQR